MSDLILNKLNRLVPFSENPLKVIGQIINWSTCFSDNDGVNFSK